MTTSVIPIAASRLLKTEPYKASQSRSRKRGAVSPWERFNYLRRKPRCRGMPHNIDLHNLSATMRQDDHNVEQSKRGRHRDEHVDGGDADCFVAQRS